MEAAIRLNGLCITDYEDSTSIVRVSLFYNTHRPATRPNWFSRVGTSNWRVTATLIRTHNKLRENEASLNFLHLLHHLSTEQGSVLDAVNPCLNRRLVLNGS